MARQNKNSVGLIDVARAAGVSTATASLALKENSRISAETRERVRKAVESTGYRYNRLAAKLRTGQTMTVGLLITDISNPYFAALAAGVETVMDEHGYMVFLVNSGDNSTRQSRQIATLMEHGVDGVLLSPADGTDVKTMTGLVESDLPVVQVSRWVDGLPFDIIGPDNIAVARELTEHLLMTGHKRIGFIGGADGGSVRIERLAGYHQALTDAGLAVDPLLTPVAPPTRSNGARLLHQIIKLDNPPTAVICYHDLMALGALEAAYEIGLTVGTDLAIAGFDDITEAALCRPALTTVHIDAESIGRTAAIRLLARIKGDDSDPAHSIVPAHLVVRESCGSALKPDPDLKSIQTAQGGPSNHE